jgi:DNA-binding transcriptional ArsR family regulator
MRATTDLDSVFHALGDPTRRAILALLARGEQATGSIAGDFTLSRPTISKHLGVLHGAGLVTRRQEGRNQLYAIAPAPLGDAYNWLGRYQRFWRMSLSQLKRYMEGRR